MKDNNGVTEDQTTSQENRAARVLTLDVDLYQGYLDDPELSTQQREEMLQALWTAICCFVDLGYKIEPQENCGQPTCAKSTAADDPRNVLISDEHTISKTFKAIRVE